MYVLVLIFIISGNNSKGEIIGAFSSLSQCKEVAITYSSRARCYYLDQQNPHNGLTETDFPEVDPILERE